MRDPAVSTLADPDNRICSHLLLSRPSRRYEQLRYSQGPASGLSVQRLIFNRSGVHNNEFAPSLQGLLPPPVRSGGFFSSFGNCLPTDHYPSAHLCTNYANKCVLFALDIVAVAVTCRSCDI